MWLFFVETYLFVLVAFTVGVVVGLVGVRIGVRRVAPARVPKVKQPKPPKTPRGKKSAESPEPAEQIGRASCRERVSSVV